MVPLLYVRPTRAGGAVAVIVALLVTAFGEPAMAKMFHLERPRVGAEFNYVSRDTVQKTPTRQSQGSSHLFTERLTARSSRGYVYHPALLLFDLRFDPVWQQTMEKREPGQDSSAKALSLDYGFNGTLLKDRPVFLQLLAQQGTSSSSGSLRPITTSEKSLHGATLVYSSTDFPTRFSYENSTAKQEGFYSSTENRDNLRLISSNKTERSRTRLNSEYDQRQRDSRGRSQLTDNASFQVTNALDVSTDRRIRLGSSLTTRWTESQSLPSTSLNLGEFLSWQHTEDEQRLQVVSNYSARYTANRRQGELSENIPLEANLLLSHRLYDNLVSSLRGNTGATSFEGGSETKYGGNANFDYNRRVPFGGVSLNMGQSYQITDRTTTTDFILVDNEELAFVDPEFPALGSLPLANRNIDDSSEIEVFPGDPSEWEYELGFDYTVNRDSAFVRIVPVFDSRLEEDIKNGKKALVSYQYRSDPSAKTATQSRSFGAGLSFWSILDLRYQLTMTRQELESGTPSELPLNDDTSQSISAQLRYRWSDTLLTYDNEKRAAGDSRSRWQARQKFYWKPLPDLTLMAGGSYSETEMPEINSNTQTYQLNAGGQWKASANQNWRLDAFQNISSSNRPHSSESTGLGLSYRLRFKAWNLQAGYRHVLDRQPLVGQERSMNTVNLTLSRSFF